MKKGIEEENGHGVENYGNMDKRTVQVMARHKKSGNVG